MKKNSINLRTIAAAVTFFFSVTSAIPLGFAEFVTPLPERIPLAALELNLPPELGKIEESYVPSTAPSGPFILHLQTAHGDINTQKRVQEILRFVRDSSQIRLVFAEGASEKLDPELLRFFSNPARNSKMANLLLARGLYTGVDLFLLDDKSRKVEILGIEKPRLYRAAYENFKKVLIGSDARDSALRTIEMELARWASKVLSKDQLVLVKEWEKFQENRRSILASFNFLEARAEKDLKIDLKDPFSQLAWPQLVRLARLREFDRDLDREKLASEKASDVFKTLPSEEELEKDPRRHFEHFLEGALRHGFRFSDYPNITRWMASLILRSEIDQKALGLEFDRLWEKLKDLKIRTAEEREIFARYEELMLLKKLLRLELTREEWKKVKTIDYRPQTKDPSNREGLWSSVFGLLSDPIRFYRLAERRDAVFFETVAREMKSRKAQKAVLVTGGFHTNGLTRIFKEKGFGYAVISPRMGESVDSDIYRKTMLELAQMEKIEMPQPSLVKEKMGLNTRAEIRIVREAFKEITTQIPAGSVGLLWQTTPYAQSVGFQEPFNAGDVFAVGGSRLEGWRPSMRLLRKPPQKTSRFLMTSPVSFLSLKQIGYKNQQRGTNGSHEKNTSTEGLGLQGEGYDQARENGGIGIQTELYQVLSAFWRNLQRGFHSWISLISAQGRKSQAVERKSASRTILRAFSSGIPYQRTSLTKDPLNRKQLTTTSAFRNWLPHSNLFTRDFRIPNLGSSVQSSEEPGREFYISQEENYNKLNPHLSSRGRLRRAEVRTNPVLELELSDHVTRNIDRSARLLLPYPQLLTAVNLLLHHEEIWSVQKLTFDFSAPRDFVELHEGVLSLHLHNPDGFSTEELLQLFERDLRWSFDQTLLEIRREAPFLLRDPREFDALNVILHERMAGMGDLVFAVNVAQGLGEAFPTKKIRLIFHKNDDFQTVLKTKLLKHLDANRWRQEVDGIEVINAERYPREIIGPNDVSILYALGRSPQEVFLDRPLHDRYGGQAKVKVRIHELGFTSPVQDPRQSLDGHLGFGEDEIGMPPFTSSGIKFYSRSKESPERVQAMRRRILMKFPGWKKLNLEQTVASQWGFLYAHQALSLDHYFERFESARQQSKALRTKYQTFFIVTSPDDYASQEKIRQIATENNYHLFFLSNKSRALQQIHQARWSRVQIILDYSVPRKLFGELFLYSNDLPTLVTGQDNLANILYLNLTAGGRPFFWEVLDFQHDARDNLLRFLEREKGAAVAEQLRRLWLPWKERKSEITQLFANPSKYRGFFKQVAMTLEEHESFLPQLYYLILRGLEKSLPSRRAEVRAAQYFGDKPLPILFSELKREMSSARSEGRMSLKTARRVLTSLKRQLKGKSLKVNGIQLKRFEPEMIWFAKRIGRDIFAYKFYITHDGPHVWYLDLNIHRGPYRKDSTTYLGFSEGRLLWSFQFGEGNKRSQISDFRSFENPSGDFPLTERSPFVSFFYNKKSHQFVLKLKSFSYEAIPDSWKQELRDVGLRLESLKSIPRPMPFYKAPQDQAIKRESEKPYLPQMKEMHAVLKAENVPVLEPQPGDLGLALLIPEKEAADYIKKVLKSYQFPKAEKEYWRQRAKAEKVAGRVFQMADIEELAQNWRQPLSKFLKALEIPKASKEVVVLQANPSLPEKQRALFEETMHVLEGKPYGIFIRMKASVDVREVVNDLLQLMFYPPDKLDEFESSYTDWNFTTKEFLQNRYLKEGKLNPNEGLPLMIKALALDAKQNPILKIEDREIRFLDLLMNKQIGRELNESSLKFMREIYRSSARGNLETLLETERFSRYRPLFPSWPFSSRSELRTQKVDELLPYLRTLNAMPPEIMRLKLKRSLLGTIRASAKGDNTREGRITAFEAILAFLLESLKGEYRQEALELLAMLFPANDVYSHRILQSLEDLRTKGDTKVLQEFGQFRKLPPSRAEVRLPAGEAGSDGDFSEEPLRSVYEIRRDLERIYSNLERKGSRKNIYFYGSIVFLSAVLFIFYIFPQIRRSLHQFLGWTLLWGVGTFLMLWLAKYLGSYSPEMDQITDVGRYAESERKRIWKELLESLGLPLEFRWDPDFAESFYEKIQAVVPERSFNMVAQQKGMILETTKSFREIIDHYNPPYSTELERVLENMDWYLENLLVDTLEWLEDPAENRHMLGIVLGRLATMERIMGRLVQSPPPRAKVRREPQGRRIPPGSSKTNLPFLTPLGIGATLWPSFLRNRAISLWRSSSTRNRYRNLAGFGKRDKLFVLDSERGIADRGLDRSLSERRVTPENLPHRHSTSQEFEHRGDGNPRSAKAGSSVTKIRIARDIATNVLREILFHGKKYIMSFRPDQYEDTDEKSLRRAESATPEAPQNLGKAPAKPKGRSRAEVRNTDTADLQKHYEVQRKHPMHRKLTLMLQRVARVVAIPMRFFVEMEKTLKDIRVVVTRTQSRMGARLLIDRIYWILLYLPPDGIEEMEEIYRRLAAEVGHILYYQRGLKISSNIHKGVAEIYDFLGQWLVPQYEYSFQFLEFLDPLEEQIANVLFKFLKLKNKRLRDIPDPFKERLLWHRFLLDFFEYLWDRGEERKSPRDRISEALEVAAEDAFYQFNHLIGRLLIHRILFANGYDFLSTARRLGYALKHSDQFTFKNPRSFLREITASFLRRKSKAPFSHHALAGNVPLLQRKIYKTAAEEIKQDTRDHKRGQVKWFRWKVASSLTDPYNRDVQKLIAEAKGIAREVIVKKTKSRAEAFGERRSGQGADEEGRGPEQRRRAEVRKVKSSLVQFFEKSLGHPRTNQRQVTDSLTSREPFQSNNLGLGEPHRDKSPPGLGKAELGRLEFPQKVGRIVGSPEFRLFLEGLELWYLGPSSFGHGLSFPRIKPSFSIRHIPGRDRADRTSAEVAGHYQQIPSVIRPAIDQIKPSFSFEDIRSMVTSLLDLLRMHPVAGNMVDSAFVPFKRTDSPQAVSPSKGTLPVYTEDVNSFSSRAEVRKGSRSYIVNRKSQTRQIFSDELRLTNYDLPPFRAEVRASKQAEEDIAFAEAVSNLNLNKDEDVQALHAFRFLSQFGNLRKKEKEKLVRLPLPVIDLEELKDEIEMEWKGPGETVNVNKELIGVLWREENGETLLKYLIHLFRKDPKTGKFFNPSHIRFFRKLGTQPSPSTLTFDPKNKILSISKFHRKHQESIARGVIKAFEKGLLEQTGTFGQDSLIVLAEIGFSELALQTLDQIAGKRIVPNLSLLKKQIRDTGQLAKGKPRAEVRTSRRGLDRQTVIESFKALSLALHGIGETLEEIKDREFEQYDSLEIRPEEVRRLRAHRPGTVPEVLPLHRMQIDEFTKHFLVEGYLDSLQAVRDQLEGYGEWIFKRTPEEREIKEAGERATREIRDVREEIEELQDEIQEWDDLDKPRRLKTLKDLGRVDTLLESVRERLIPPTPESYLQKIQAEISKDKLTVRFTLTDDLWRQGEVWVPFVREDVRLKFPRSLLGKTLLLRLGHAARDPHLQVIRVYEAVPGSDRFLYSYVETPESGFIPSDEKIKAGPDYKFTHPLFPGETFYVSSRRGFKRDDDQNAFRVRVDDEDHLQGIADGHRHPLRHSPILNQFGGDRIGTMIFKSELPALRWGSLGGVITEIPVRLGKSSRGPDYSRSYIRLVDLLGDQDRYFYVGGDELAGARAAVRLEGPWPVEARVRREKIRWILKRDPHGRIVDAAREGFYDRIGNFTGSVIGFKVDGYGRASLGAPLSGIHVADATGNEIWMSAALVNGVIIRTDEWPHAPPLDVYEFTSDPKGFFRVGLKKKPVLVSRRTPRRPSKPHLFNVLRDFQFKPLDSYKQRIPSSVYASHTGVITGIKIRRHEDQGRVSLPDHDYTLPPHYIGHRLEIYRFAREALTLFVIYQRKGSVVEDAYLYHSGGKEVEESYRNIAKTERGLAQKYHYEADLDFIWRAKERAERLFRRARLAFRQGHFRKAKQFFRKVPKKARTYYLAARVYLHKRIPRYQKILKSGTEAERRRLLQEIDRHRARAEVRTGMAELRNVKSKIQDSGRETLRIDWGATQTAFRRGGVSLDGRTKMPQSLLPRHLRRQHPEKVSRYPLSSLPPFRSGSSAGAINNAAPNRRTTKSPAQTFGQSGKVVNHIPTNNAPNPNSAIRNKLLANNTRLKGLTFVNLQVSLPGVNGKEGHYHARRAEVRTVHNILEDMSFDTAQGLIYQQHGLRKALEKVSEESPEHFLVESEKPWQLFFTPRSYWASWFSKVAIKVNEKKGFIEVSVYSNPKDFHGEALASLAPIVIQLLDEALKNRRPSKEASDSFLRARRAKIAVLPLQTKKPVVTVKGPRNIDSRIGTVIGSDLLVLTDAFNTAKLFADNLKSHNPPDHLKAFIENVLGGNQPVPERLANFYSRPIPLAIWQVGFQPTAGQHLHYLELAQLLLGVIRIMQTFLWEKGQRDLEALEQWAGSDLAGFVEGLKKYDGFTGLVLTESKLQDKQSLEGVVRHERLHQPVDLLLYGESPEASQQHLKNDLMKGFQIFLAESGFPILLELFGDDPHGGKSPYTESILKLQQGDFSFLGEFLVNTIYPTELALLSPRAEAYKRFINLITRLESQNPDFKKMMAIMRQLQRKSDLKASDDLQALAQFSRAEVRPADRPGAPPHSGPTGFRAEVRTSELSGDDLLHFRLRLSARQEKIIAQIVRGINTIISSPEVLEGIPTSRGGGKLTEEEIRQFLSLPQRDFGKIKTKLFNEIPSEKHARYLTAWNGLLAKKNFTAYLKRYAERRERAVASTWEKLASLQPSFEKIRKMSFERFRRLNNILMVPHLKGGDMPVLIYISPEGYKVIEEARENHRKDKRTGYKAPEQLSWRLRAHDIRGPDIYMFPEQIAYERKRGHFIGKGAIFHELLEKALDRQGVRDETIIFYEFDSHQDLAVLEGELQFAALLGKRTFEKALRDRETDILRLEKYTIANERFPLYLERLKKLVGEANYETYRKAGLAIWERAGGIRAEVRKEAKWERILADPKVKEEIEELSGREITPETAFELGRVIGAFHVRYSKEVLVAMLRALRVMKRKVEEEKIPVYLRKILEAFQAQGIPLRPERGTGQQVLLFDRVPSASEISALVFSLVLNPGRQAEVVIFPRQTLSAKEKRRVRRFERRLKGVQDIEGNPIPLGLFESEKLQEVKTHLTKTVTRKFFKGGSSNPKRMVVTLEQGFADWLEKENPSLLSPLYRQVHYGRPQSHFEFFPLFWASSALSETEYRSLAQREREMLEEKVPARLYQFNPAGIPDEARWSAVSQIAQAQLLETLAQAA